ncbi:MAG: 3-deoxy-D-manno-octulosonic-acid transferase [Rickettsiales bacterium]|jgi:3-deoxy-D-manno-octulosonic-acid transferase
MIFTYQTLSVLLSPFITLYLLFRKLKKKEDQIRFGERFGYSKITKPNGSLIWIHSASVGESKSALTLAEKLLKQYPKINILMTSGTITSASEIGKNLPERTIHQFIPVDTLFAVKRFLKHWKPDLAMFVESELWPNLIIQTKKYACDLILINGRISDRSFKHWKILHKLNFNLLKNFSLCLAQSPIDRQKFIDLGIKNVQFVGNLKLASKPLKVNQDQLEKLKYQIGTRKFWFAASTHQGEEEIIIKAHQKLKEYFPELLTIIAPRHPNRIKEIVQLIPKDLKIALHSQNEEITNCDIYLVDVLGELGTFYSLSKISLIAGSMLENIGGHNPFEALQLESVILSGIYVKNFEEIYKNLKNTNACQMIKNEAELLFYILKIMKDKNDYSLRLKNTKNLSANNEKILENILEEISKIHEIKS